LGQKEKRMKRATLRTFDKGDSIADIIMISWGFCNLKRRAGKLQFTAAPQKAGGWNFFKRLESCLSENCTLRIQKEDSANRSAAIFFVEQIIDLRGNTRFLRGG
jgi:hypothetical protein